MVARATAISDVQSVTMVDCPGRGLMPCFLRTLGLFMPPLVSSYLNGRFREVALSSGPAAPTRGVAGCGPRAALQDATLNGRSGLVAAVRHRPANLGGDSLDTGIRLVPCGPGGGWQSRTAASGQGASSKPTRTDRGSLDFGGGYLGDLEELFEYCGLVLLEVTAHVPVVDQFRDVASREHEI